MEGLELVYEAAQRELAISQRYLAGSPAELSV
jgi:hypothetical protein